MADSQSWSSFNITWSPILDIDVHGFILNTCQDKAKRAETKVGFPVIFSRLWWPIEPKFSQICYFYINKLWYTKCGPLDNTVYMYLKHPMALIRKKIMIRIYMYHIKNETFYLIQSNKEPQGNVPCLRHKCIIYIHLLRATQISNLFLNKPLNCVKKYNLIN